MKSPPNKSGARTEQFDLYIEELQFAHFISGALISIAVTHKRLLPAGHSSAARKKSEIGRAPVALHEVFEIAAVPGQHLTIQHRANRLHFGLRSLRLCDPRTNNNHT